MRTLGIDLASQPENTALCVVSWADDGRGVEVEPPRAGWDDEALLAEMARADAVGIDAPFGWPAAFVSAVAVAGEGWPAGVAVDALRFRETDRFVRSWTGEVLGRRLSPLSVSADRIAYCAWRCRSLLARHRGTSRVYEVYPAAALAVWGRTTVTRLFGIYGRARRHQLAMVGAIVAFRIDIERIDAKFKLSQNRDEADRRRVASALRSEGYADATATAAWMDGQARDD